MNDVQRELDAALEAQDRLVSRIAQLHNENMKLRAALKWWGEGIPLAGSHGESVGVREADLSNTVGPNLNPDAALASERSGSKQDMARYHFWRAHPRSYFVINVDQDSALTLKLHAVPVEAWDKAYAADNVDAALDEALRLYRL